jgi:hypothetical protein
LVVARAAYLAVLDWLSVSARRFLFVSTVLEDVGDVLVRPTAEAQRDLTSAFSAFGSVLVADPASSAS